MTTPHVFIVDITTISIYLINVMIPNLYAHSGESNLANPLFVWTLDPSVVVITIFAYFYFRGLTKYRRKLNHKYPLWRAICFVAGFVFLILALCSPIDYLANSYFYFHMIQHLLVVMFAAPLLLLGLPVLPVVSGACHYYFPNIYYFLR